MVEKTGALTLAKIKQLQWHKLFYMFYIEPLVFALVFAHSLTGTIMKNQIIYQTCTNIHHYNESDCKQLGTKNTSENINAIETDVQQYVANMFMIRTLLESIIPAVCGVFVGSWSDHYGRKPLTVISMIGFSCTYVLTAIISEMSLYYPVNPWYYIIAALPHSILGGNCVFMVAAFCFLSDVTDRKTRPYRMIFMEVFLFVGLTSGSLLSSYLLAATSATFVYALAGVVLCMATVFIMIYMPESLHLKHDDDQDNDDQLAKQKQEDIRCDELQMQCADIMATGAKLKENDTTTTSAATTIIPSLKSEKFDDKNTKDTKDKESANLFSYIHLKDMFVTCFKPRECYDRCIIWLITGAMFVSIFVMDGAMTVFYLFVREKFHWTVRDFTFFETVSHSVPMLGALVGFVILRKIFRLSVVTLALLAFFSSILNAVINGLASEPWHLYLAAAVGVFKSVSGPMCRTIVSNIVPATDLGKIFSVKNVLQSIAPFVAAPLYTFIYKRSITTFPGLFNIVSASLFTIAFIFLLFVQRFRYAHKEHYAKILK